MTETETARLRVRELRLDKGWTQTQLAARANTHAGEISRIESGRNVTTDVLYRIAEALGRPVRDLFPPEVPEPPPRRTKPETVARSMAGMDPDPGDMATYARGWAGPGKRGLERLRLLKDAADRLGPDDGKSPVTARIAAMAAYWGLAYDLIADGVLSEREAEKLSEAA